MDLNLAVDMPVVLLYQSGCARVMKRQLTLTLNVQQHGIVATFWHQIWRWIWHSAVDLAAGVPVS